MVLPLHDLDGAVSNEWTNTTAMPNWGYPYGWGIMQIDTGANQIREQCLWNWQENVRKGLWILNEKLNNRVETGTTGRGARQFWADQIEDFLRYNANNPDNPVSPPVTTGYHNIYFAYSPHGNEKSYRDAIWIKQYNGAETNFIS